MTDRDDTSRVEAEPAEMSRQEARARATRKLISEATIDCLVHLGYAGTSLGAVQKRAGVSRGALMHHFSTKTEMLAAALELSTDDLQRDLLARIRESIGEDQQRTVLLDSLWELHRGPVFLALLEVWSAARTDPALLEAVVETERIARRRQRSLFREVLGDRIVSCERFVVLMEMTFSMMRGSALMRAITPADRVDGRGRIEKAVSDEWHDLFSHVVDEIVAELGDA